MKRNFEWMFFSKWFIAPLRVASITPRSGSLAKAMAAALPAGDGVVVELGGQYGADYPRLAGGGCRCALAGGHRMRRLFFVTISANGFRDQRSPVGRGAICPAAVEAITCIRLTRIDNRKVAICASIPVLKNIKHDIGSRLVTINGSCFCGAVRYKIEGELRDARSCHCSMCRKAFSAQASAYALVDPEKFTWACGENLLTSYESKNGAGLLFCSVCGSTLCGTYKGKVHGVTLGCIDGDPEVEIGMHIFVGSKASWETIPEGVSQYEEWPPNGD